MSDINNPILSIKQIEHIYAKLMMSNDLQILGDLPSELSILVANAAKDDQTLMALTLVSQYHHLMYDDKPNADEKIISKVDFPKSNLPFVPVNYYKILEKIINKLESFFYFPEAQHEAFIRWFLYFLEQKGYTLPTNFWEKLEIKESESLLHINQGIYTKWQLYLKGMALKNTQSSQNYDELTAENWDEWYPSERLQILRQMRRKNPEKARALILECAPSMPADKRLKVIQIFNIGLCDDDIDVLQKLSKARSSSATKMAKRLLMRLGAINEDSVLEEFMQEFKWSKKNRLLTSTIGRKNYTKLNNLIQNLENISIHQWAKKLKITMSEFLQGWNFEKNYNFTESLFKNAAESLDSDDLIILAKNWTQELRKNFSENYWYIIKPCLPKEALEDIAYDALTKMENFFDLLHFFDKKIHISFDELCQLPAFKKLSSYGIQHLDYWDVWRNFYALALLVDDDIAKQCLQYLNEQGVSYHEDALVLLHFNALLPNSVKN